MRLALNKIEYSNLNARQQENYNFMKVSAVLADYGFVTTRLSDDWQGADFIAVHIDGETLIRVQLKGRLGFDKKYIGKNLYLAFCSEGEWYLYPHDELLNQVLEKTGIGTTESWAVKGGYHFPYLSPDMRKLVAPFKLGSQRLGKARRVQPARPRRNQECYRLENRSSRNRPRC